MCLIIARNSGTRGAIPTEYIEASIGNNPDGFGIVGRDSRGNVEIFKSLDMDKAEGVIRQFEREDGGNLDLMIHFRYATHGAVDDRNCHPFQIHGENYLMHNGVLKVPTPVPDHSDTWHFVEDLKDLIAPDRLSRKAVRRFMETRSKLITGSKFAVLGRNVPLTIINEKDGFREDGIWYSNYYSLTPPSRTTAANSSYAQWENDRFWDLLEMLDSPHFDIELDDLRQFDSDVLCDAMEYGYSKQIAEIIARDSANLTLLPAGIPFDLSGTTAAEYDTEDLDYEHAV